MHLLADFNIQEPIQSTLVKKKFNNNPISNKVNPSTMKAGRLGRTLGTAAVVGGVVATGAYLINKLKKKENNG